MKGYHFLLLCVLAAGHANARMSATSSDAQAQQDAQTHQAAGSIATNPATVALPDSPAQSAPSPNKLRNKSAARSSLSKIKRGVVTEIKATSAFVQQQAANAETSDGRLIALVLIGLVVLQLRRRHKSLPQRRIVPYG
jgi:hypothetical protein